MIFQHLNVIEGDGKVHCTNHHFMTNVIAPTKHGSALDSLSLHPKEPHNLSPLKHYIHSPLSVKTQLNSKSRNKDTKKILIREQLDLPAEQ